jgi:hypothetical protein
MWGLGSWCCEVAYQCLTGVSRCFRRQCGAEHLIASEIRGRFKSWCTARTVDPGAGPMIPKEWKPSIPTWLLAYVPVAIALEYLALLVWRLEVRHQEGRFQFGAQRILGKERDGERDRARRLIGHRPHSCPRSDAGASFTQRVVLDPV